MDSLVFQVYYYVYMHTLVQSTYQLPCEATTKEYQSEDRYMCNHMHAPVHVTYMYAPVMVHVDKVSRVRVPNLNNTSYMYQYTCTHVHVCMRLAESKDSYCSSVLTVS